MQEDDPYTLERRIPCITRLARVVRANATPVKSHAEQYDDVHRDAHRSAQYDDSDATKKALKSVANKQTK
jgi:hypothetical protein